MHTAKAITPQCCLSNAGVFLEDFDMSDNNGDASAKKVVMVTGGTGLVGVGIKEFVSTDPEVRKISVTWNKQNLRPLFTPTVVPCHYPHRSQWSKKAAHD